MNITQELAIEHQLILKINQQMADLCVKVDNLTELEILPVAHRFIQFIEEFVDSYHHNKEEEFLFEAFELPGIFAPRALIAQMLSEHKSAREALELIKHGVSTENLAELSQGIVKYQKLMRLHIFKEENYLYPLAERYLNNTVKQRVQCFYEEVEQFCNKSLLWESSADFSLELSVLLLSEKVVLH